MAGPVRYCGAPAVGGPCILEAGHNMGSADVPSAHLAASASGPMEIGRKQMVDAVGGGNESLLDRLVHDTGIYGLSYFIRRVLDEHYPVDIFGDDTSAAGIMYGVTWGSERAGDDIQPGVKWAVLLRHAIHQIERKP